ncbi:MAG: PaaI family thioesterase [Planctomycetes bacterium]|nr:PaaI family thioesterase [Planctomycetota bacterium]
MIIKEKPSIINKGHNHCCICGELNPRSLGLSFKELKPGFVSAKFSAFKELQGYEGMLHGGVISSLLDAAMTHCLFAAGIKAVTGDLHVRFLAPVPHEAELDLLAYMSSSLSPLFYLKSEIRVENKLVAKAEGKFMLSKVISEC